MKLFLAIYREFYQNWKIKCKIRVRDIEQSINELYPKYMGCDPNWMEIREFFCPGCYTLLETETVPSGYPVIFNFLPDIDTFYEKWLNKRVPTK
jgi:acetone carboxylase gamma subunit